MSETNTVQETRLNDEARWNLLQKKAQEMRAVKAFTLLREKGIEPVLIKGLAAAQFYPEPSSRISIDMDLAVATDEFEAADRIARSAGANGLAIDLHRELRHLDTVEWKDLVNNSRLLQIAGGEIRVLRPEDHLRVLCVHWLTDGGANKDRLRDIYYAVENRPADFDWDRFLNSVSDRRRRWLTCTVGLAHRFFGLNLGDTPIKERELDLPAWLVKTVEKEWASETKFRPIEMTLNDPKMLIKQVRKRLRPNPIWATVQMEGSFDAKTRVFYQIGNVFKRIMPSYHRIAETIMLRSK